MDFISLFSGAGGLDLGLEMAGLNSLYATDIDAAAIGSLQANQNSRVSRRTVLANTFIEAADIRTLKGKDILGRIGKQKGNVPLLAGGPPCQSWSSAGHQLGFKDPRGQLFADYIRIAKDLDVRWLLLENVRGLVTARGPDGVPGSALAQIRESLFRAGWLTLVGLLNAADFGVPQRRVRLVLMGYRSGDAPRLPIGNFHNSGPLGRSWLSLGATIASIPPLSEDEIIKPSGKLAVELSLLVPGTGVKSAGKVESSRPGGHWGYKQGAFLADLNRPARTVTANAQQDWVLDPVHGVRRLAPRECAAIQSFPEEWKFIGSRVDKYRLIGNAVPPVLAKALGESLLQAERLRAKPSKSMAKLSPLPKNIQAAIQYTIRDEAKNGASRRAAPQRRISKLDQSRIIIA